MKGLKIGFVLYVLGFIGLEVGLRLFSKPPPKREVFYLGQASEVKAERWFSQWQEEHSHLRRDFQAYEIYRQRPFQGKLITVNEQGLRATQNPPQCREQSQCRQIGLFGGSIGWGSFVRDSHTIATLLSQQLELEKKAERPSVEVTNYAEIGHVFSQQLHRAIRLGYDEAQGIPEQVLFFSGINDMSAAIDNWMKGTENPEGLPWEYDKYQHLFKLGNTGEITFGDVAKKFKTVRFSLRFFEKLGWKEREEKNFWREPSPEDLEHLSQAVANKYVELVKTAHQMLATKTGKRPIFIFPPMLMGKSTRSESEAVLLRKNKRWVRYFEETHDRIVKGLETERAIAFVDWYSLFDGVTETRFADLFHYTESANEAIAAEMVAHLLNRVSLSRQL